MKRFAYLFTVVWLFLCILAPSGLPIQSVHAAPISGAHLPRGDGVLHGTITPALKGAHQVGSTNPTQSLDLAIILPTQHADQLTTLLHNLYTPQSPSYHRWLTSVQFQTHFGLTSAQLTPLMHYLSSQRLTVSQRPGPFILDASGTVAQVETAFGVQINDYIGTDGKQFFAAASEAHVPASLAGLVSGIVGLDNAQQFHSSLPRAPAVPLYGGGPKGTGLTPSQIRSIYNATPLFTAGITGAAQRTGVFELSTYSLSDIKHYVSYYKLGFPSTNFVQVNVGTPTAVNAAEVEQDVELQLALAPGVAKFYIYNAPNTYSGNLNEYARIASDNLATSISTSWGSCEQDLISAEAASENQSFQQMAVQGQSIYAASGDDGAFDCANSTTLAVDDPASQPYVTGVGGTHLNSDPGTNPNPGYISETTWPCPSCAAGGSGGGESTIWPLPWWESGPGVNPPGSTGMREVPDVALNADSSTGYSLYCTVTASTNCTKGGWYKNAGTSGATPLWAAFTSLVNQQRAKNGLVTLGFAAPAIAVIGNSPFYGSDFHDITTGDNFVYPATLNYDMVTGWGTPNMQRVATALSMQAWNIVPSVDIGLYDQFNGVTALAANNVWAVGESSVAGSGGDISSTLVEHWTGTSWNSVSSPNAGASLNNLDALASVSPSDIWAVGVYSDPLPYVRQTLIEHWDGKAWSVIPSPSPGSGGANGTNELYGVAAASANDVWAVGITTTGSNGGVTQTLIEHWDGTAWSVIPSPNGGPGGPGTNNQLIGVTAVSANNVWAVGDYTGANTNHAMIQHWDGTTWTVSATLSGYSSLRGITAISANNIWAVGFSQYSPSGYQPLTVHWNGTSWSIIPSPSLGVTSQLFGVAAVSANDVWVVGTTINPDQTLIEHWNGTAWSVIPSPNPPNSYNDYLPSVAVDAVNDVWTVGSYCCANAPGFTFPQTLVERWTGTS